MKHLPLALLLTSSLSFALDNRLLLVRESYPGANQAPWTKQVIKCEIWNNRILIHRQMADVESTEERLIGMDDKSLQALQQLMSLAEKGTLESKSVPTDGPFVNYAAKGTQDIVLENTDPQGAVQKTNTAQEATTLRLLIDSHCGSVR